MRAARAFEACPYCGVATSYTYLLGALPQGRVELGVVALNATQHPSRVYPRLFARTYARRIAPLEAVAEQRRSPPPPPNTSPAPVFPSRSPSPASVVTVRGRAPQEAEAGEEEEAEAAASAGGGGERPAEEDCGARRAWGPVRTAHTRMLFSMSSVSSTAFCSQDSIAEVGSGARRSRFISPTSSNPALTHP